MSHGSRLVLPVTQEGHSWHFQLTSTDIRLCDNQGTTHVFDGLDAVLHLFPFRRWNGEQPGDLV